MGMTLPLLTVYFNDTLQNIGASTGTLYLFNTLGAAFGAWIAAEWLFSAWGLDQSAWLAAVLNLGCGTVVVLASRAQKYFGKTVSILKDS
ncbi:hypothetical protein D3C71_1461490 [compost metagenome]